MKISIHDPYNNKFYDIFYSLKDENKIAPLERVFRDSFVKDLLYYEYDLNLVKESLNVRPFNLNVYSIVEL
jgi:hypothetical protein